MILLSHPTANENVRQTALALAEAGLLEEFWSCINWRRGSWLDSSLGVRPRLRAELRRRSFAPALAPFLHSHGWREWGRQLLGQIGSTRLTNSETGLFSIDAVYRALDRRVARRLLRLDRLKAVYAYDDGARKTFRAARSRGLRCIYEHPTVYWRAVQKLQREEAERRPEWAPTLRALSDSPAKLARKDEEIALADVVVTASTFSARSLAGAPELRAEVRVIPYGADLSGGQSLGEKFPPNEKLRVLFVGALTQAKGLGYLLDAISRLGREVEFSLIGRQVSAEIPAPSLLAKYRWLPSLPHHELLAEISRHDVLVLPSLHEGFGLVLTEAMSQGVAIIATPHTAAPDLITDGVEGFLVPIRSADAIEEKLALLANDRDRLAEMRRAATRKAISLKWENYRQAIAQMAREVMEEMLTR